MSETFLTPDDVSAQYGMSPGYWRAEVRAGRIPAYRFGRLVKLRQEDVDNYVESIRQPAVSA
jgi:excisionase family DNA binding protein